MVLATPTKNDKNRGGWDSKAKIWASCKECIRPLSLLHRSFTTKHKLHLCISRTMKICLFFALAAVAIPFASSQSLAPSAADTTFESLVPTVRDARCSAYPLCAAEDLADDCCPTIENVFLDCCEMDMPPSSAPVVNTPTEPDIVDVLSSDSRFTTLVDAVLLTGLAPPLQGEGPLTVFAPTNDAFAAIDTSGLTTEQLTSVLLYHVVGGEVLLEDGLSVTTLNGADVLLSVAFDETKVNEANIEGTIPASNGAIYVIDAVLLPPSPDTPAPTPGADTPPPSPVEDPSMMPSTETDIETFVPTGADSSAPTVNTLPTEGAPDTEIPSIVTLTSRNYDGCIKINGDGDVDDDFRLSSCDASDPKQQFSFVGDQIQLAMDTSKCLQAGRNVMPEDGRYLRVYACDDDETLQKFTWDAPDGALTLVDWPDYAVVFRGTTANVNVDPIILGDLNKAEVFERKDWIVFN